MVRGLYTATAGALVAEMDASTIANNLANVTTTGFKQSLLQISSAPSMDIYRLQTDPGTTQGTTVPGSSSQQYVGPLGLGASAYDTPTIYDQGGFNATENPFDLAIAGQGFFTIQTAQGIRYTRDGSFLRNSQNQLTTQSGDLVLGKNGPLTIPDGLLTADKNGNLSLVDANAPTQPQRQLGTLLITEFGNLSGLRAEGANRFVDGGTAVPSATVTQSTVIQGSLETSNANVVRSMVDLISAQRWFEANMKMVQAQDTLNNEAITSVGQNNS